MEKNEDQTSNVSLADIFPIFLGFMVAFNCSFRVFLFVVWVLYQIQCSFNFVYILVLGSEHCRCFMQKIIGLKKLFPAFFIFILQSKWCLKLHWLICFVLVCVYIEMRGRINKLSWFFLALYPQVILIWRKINKYSLFCYFAVSFSLKFWGDFKNVYP